jgi:hypothetical protein
MFFGELGHAEVLQMAAEHPMIQRVAGGKLVGLSFVEVGFVKLACCPRRAGKLVVGQYQMGVALHSISPNRHGFLPATELPK